MVRVLGIDPGTATTGFGVIDAERAQVHVDAGVIKTEAGLPLQQRLHTIYENLLTLIEQHRPDQVAVEELYFAANVKTAISVSHARGVILLACASHGLEVYSYTPLAIKQALSGYGRAEKQQMQEMVRLVLNLQDIPRPDDAADALAVAICHTQTHHA